MALILVVEDDPISQRLLRTVIEQLGHIAVVCRNGRLAYEILEDNYDVTSIVITDVMMPELDGQTLLGKIRSNSKMKHLPVIIQSAYLGATAIKQLIEQGATAILHKPIDTNVLKEYINESLEPQIEEA